MREAAEYRSGRHRVLVVDDDPDWRDTLRLVLEDQGYEVVEASNGPEALDRLRNEPFAIALLDMRMPGMSGREVVEKLPDNRHPRIVFLTAASSAADDVRGALATGAHYYLPKDARPEMLTLLLESLDS